MEEQNILEVRGLCKRYDKFALEQRFRFQTSAEILGSECGKLA